MEANYLSEDEDFFLHDGFLQNQTDEALNESFIKDDQVLVFLCIESLLTFIFTILCMSIGYWTKLVSYIHV